MATDPPAPDLRAIQARYADITSRVFYMEMDEAADFMADDVPKLLAAYDAQAARLAAYRSVLEEVAADDNPKDGCAHADAAKAVLENDV